MSGPVDIPRPTAADIVEDMARIIALLNAGRLQEADQKRLAPRLRAVMGGDRGLRITGGLLPMESERSASTIARIAERNRHIAAFAERYFSSKPSEASRTLESRLRRYQSAVDWQADRRKDECPERLLGKPSEFCWRILKANDGAALSARSIRRIISGQECARNMASETWDDEISKE